MKFTQTYLTQTTGFSFSGAFRSLDYDNSFNFEEFKEEFSISIKSLTKEQIIFEMKGIDASLANAFRRIMISEVNFGRGYGDLTRDVLIDFEMKFNQNLNLIFKISIIFQVPTVAIEKVEMINNTSVIQDEVLAHRLGLIPIAVDPRNFDFKPLDKKSELINTIRDSLKFRLHVSCHNNPPGSATKFTNSVVYSKHLEWVPINDEQKELFADNPPRVVHDDIILAKLRPNQTIELECYCEKGIGATHAKWSPSATASYRLMPEITFSGQGVFDEEAKVLKQLCPMNVFDIEELGNSSHPGEPSVRAVVARPRDCTTCRECIRGDWSKKVNLKRIKDHFIFSVETSGVLRPEDIFKESLKIFTAKCRSVLVELQRINSGGGASDAGGQMEEDGEEEKIED